MNKLYLLLFLGVIFLSIKTFAINQSTKIDNDNKVPKKETIISEKNQDIFPDKNDEQLPQKEPIVIEKNQDIVHSNKISLKTIFDPSINFLKENWIELTQLLLTMILIFVGWQGSKIQLKSAKATHKVNQYKERLKVSKSVEALWLKSNHNEITIEVLNDFWIEIQPARWLFDEELNSTLKEFYSQGTKMLTITLSPKDLNKLHYDFDKMYFNIKDLIDSYMDIKF